MRLRRVTQCAVLALAAVLAASPGMAQTAESPTVAAPPAAAQSAQTADQAPLTPRERELLQRVQELEERLKAVEQKVTPDSSPAAAKVLPAKMTQGAPAEPSSSHQSASAQEAADNTSSSVQTASSNAKSAPAQGKAASSSTEENNYEEPKMWGEWNPGQGFSVAKTEHGDLNLSGYMVTRYLNQLPPDQTATDHLGRPIPVQARQDFQLHRVMLYTSGWLLDPKFQYFTFVWTVNDTTQVAVGGALTYNFHKRFWMGIGINPLPVNRTLQGNHPYWPSYDRMMADEFFRPFFTQGIFGGGEALHRLYYKWMVGNNLSVLGVRATQLTRELNFGGSLTWLPTTGEFGPRGALGDFEDHEKLATRFGIGYGVSRENRQSNENDPANNTTIRLADSLNVFDTGAFADGVTVQKVTYHLVAADVGFKKRGFWIGGEGYYRLLDNFNATGPIPVGSVRDTGFYAQGTYMAIPKLVELYAGTSYVFSHFGNSPKEFLFGGNYYPAKNRNYRLNVHVINVDHSPVNSTFGFYMGQLKGPIVAIGLTALY